MKAKTLGWNAAAPYGIEPITAPAGFTAAELEAARIEHPVSTMLGVLRPPRKYASSASTTWAGRTILLRIAW